MSDATVRPVPKKRRGTRTEGHLEHALEALHRCEFDVRLSPGGDASPGLAAASNALATRTQRLCEELARVASAGGTEGDLTARAAMGEDSGGWATCLASVNGLVTDLMQPTAELARVIDAVAKGDLTLSVPLV